MTSMSEFECIELDNEISRANRWLRRKPMNWNEHLEWCKKRALEYVDRGQLADAVASMGSDLQKHPEAPKNKETLGALFMIAMLAVSKGDSREVRRWIEGWH